jgi:hypothetical protein
LAGRNAAFRNAALRKRQRRYFAAEDRRFVNFQALERASDLRIRAHALRSAVHGDFRLIGAHKEFHLQRGGMPERSVTSLSSCWPNPSLDAVTV